MSVSPLDIIKARQREWATRRGRSLDEDGYCESVHDNIFGGLSPRARKDFDSGDGTELGKPGERGKMQAVHSSSALACNWFDHWRGRNLEPLSCAFDNSSALCEFVGFEQKFSTPLGGIGPNLDVALKCVDGSLFAIESKFTEPYTPSSSKTFLKPKYFSRGRSLWAEAGLPGCQVVAEALRTGRHDFKVLDVAQLLKHMLALASNGQSWSLCCLWFELSGPVADRHRQELTEFTGHIGGDAAHLVSLTYQELFARMQRFVREDDSEYVGYLSDRYLLQGGDV